MEDMGELGMSLWCQEGNTDQYDIAPYWFMILELSIPNYVKHFHTHHVQTVNFLT